jgi:hypothetical protein
MPGHAMYFPVSPSTRSSIGRSFASSRSTAFRRRRSGPTAAALPAASRGWMSPVAGGSPGLRLFFIASSMPPGQGDERLSETLYPQPRAS